MDFLYGVFSLLCVISIVLGIIGLIKPKWATFGKFPEAKRLQVFGGYFVIMIVSAIGVSTFTSPERAALNAQHKQERQLKANQEKEAKNQQELLSNKEKEQQQYIDIIKNAVGTTTEQAKQIYSTFQGIEASQLKSMMLIDKERSAYQWEAAELGKNVIAIAYIPNGVVEKIVFKNNVLYENGKITGTVSDEVLTSLEYDMAEDYAVKAVTERLKAPRNADFDKGHFRYSKHKNIITVVGTVDAQNSFGAMLRNKFVVEIDLNKNTYTLVSIE